MVRMEPQGVRIGVFHPALLLSQKGSVHELQQQQQLSRLQRRALGREGRDVTVSDGRVPASVLGKMLRVEDGTDPWFSPGPRDPSLLLLFGLELMILLFWLLACLVLRSHYKCLIAC